jgi:hypothetical protein
VLVSPHLSERQLSGDEKLAVLDILEEVSGGDEAELSVILRVSRGGGRGRRGRQRECSRRKD